MATFSVVTNAAEVIAKAHAVADHEVEKFIAELTRQMGKIPANKRETANRRIGKAAEDGLRRGYAMRSNNRNLPPYRGGAGRNPGALSGVISREGVHFHADSQGVSFLDEDLLTREASHWRRINFGAGDTSVPKSFPVRPPGRRTSGQAIKLQVPASPQDAFIMPRGRFKDPSSGQFQSFGEPGTGHFYPFRSVLLRGGPRPRRASIQASHFVDEGVRAMATEMSKSYDTMMRSHFNSVTKKLPKAIRRIVKR